MGRTPKPLRILALPPCDQWDELKELETKGHVIRNCEDTGDLRDFDLVVGANCWYLDQAHRPYLDLAIAAARKKRYGKGKEEET